MSDRLSLVGMLCAEVERLTREVERLTRDLELLVDKNEPEPHALHYDECLYKPFADLPRGKEPENSPACTCSELHKGTYWKARWMLTAGWRQIAERERDEALAQVAMVVEEGREWVEAARLRLDDLTTWLQGEGMTRKNALWIILGFWVLWAWSGVGWEGVWVGERDECLRALKMTRELSTSFTCIPAGVLLRPLRLRGVETQPAMIQPYAEFDLSPEFRP